MSIIQGVQASSSKLIPKTQFVIKSKIGSNKQNKNTIISSNTINYNIDEFNEQNQMISKQPTNSDINQFLSYMIQKSKRFEQLIISKNILNKSQFIKKFIYGSTCIKTILKSVLDKLFDQKRLGKNLKGMNQANLIQIQSHIWCILERQVTIYKNEKQYQKQRDQLKKDILNRKKQLLKQLENVNKNILGTQQQNIVSVRDTIQIQNMKNLQQRIQSNEQILNQQFTQFKASIQNDQSFFDIQQKCDQINSNINISNKNNSLIPNIKSAVLLRKRFQSLNVIM